MNRQVKNSKWFLLYSLIILILIFGCRQENIITLPEDENAILERNDVISDLILAIATNDGSIDNVLDFANCFRIKLPVNVIANGREVSIKTNEDLDLIRAIFQESSVDTDMVELVFPVTAILTDYSEQTLTDQEALDRLAATCNDENEPDEDNECIDFLYPINFTVFNTLTEQTSNVVIQNDNELYRFVRELTSDEVAKLNFPVTLVLSDDSQEVANTLEELEEIIENSKDAGCDEDDDFDFLDDDFNDIQSPSTPLNLVASNSTENSIDLSWEASVDNIGVVSYAVYVNDELRIKTQNTSITIIELEADTSYRFYVIAEDAAGNISGESNEVLAQTLPSPDTTAPSAPSNLVASNTTQTTTDLSWDAATDNIAVIGYEIYQDGVVIGTTAETSYNVSQLTASTTYTFTVIAIDEAGNNSVSSNALNVNTLAPTGDTQAPSIPLNLTAENTNEADVDLNWDASTDNVEVIGYDVYIDDVFLVFVPNTKYRVKDLSYGRSYTFKVLAKDAEGNTSAFSNEATITIQPTPTEVDISVLVTCSDWIIEHMARNNNNLTDMYSDYVLNFLEDGTLSISDGTQTFVGTWKQEPFGGIISKIIIDVPDLPDFNLDWVQYYAREFQENTIVELRRQLTVNVLRLKSQCN